MKRTLIAIAFLAALTGCQNTPQQQAVVAADAGSLATKTAAAIAAIPTAGPGQNNMLGWFAYALQVGADLTPVLQEAQQTVTDLQSKPTTQPAAK